MIRAACLLLLTGSTPHAAELKLPDPLVTQGGRKVEAPDDWKAKRRPEVLELFRENVYGYAPIGRPGQLSFATTQSTRDAMDGKATRKLVNVCYQGPGGTGTIHLVLFIPNGRSKPAPCFLLICNRDPENIDPSRKVKSPFWPAEQIVARGYAAAVFYNADVAPDKYDHFTNGVFSIFDPPSGRRANSWGTIAAWAWGASRVMDYLETDPDIDAKRVAVVGHSRGGKTALWAGAEDERFAMVVSNESGSTGAALARNKQGEHIRDINQGFPHWFCENYKRYNDREDQLPVDQHMLAALIAPRLLYIASASEDRWSDPTNEFLAAVHAGPVYRLLGLKDLGTTVMPKPEAPVQQGAIAYHLRTGKHNLTEYDWGQFMDFADRHHWRVAAAPAAGHASTNAAVRLEHDVPYLEPGRSEKADLYLPANLSPGQRCPGVVIIHGGGWSGGNKRAAREINIGTTLASHGYVGMSINYALAVSNKVTWPQNLYDCKTAVRWLRKNADRLQVDAAHVGVIGGSAGGHLAAMLAVTGPADQLDPAQPYGEFSCRVQCAVDLYGPAELLQYHNVRMLGKTQAEAPALYRAASPTTYADKHDPPILILHGTADKTVDLKQSELFAAALEAAGAPHELVIVPGAPHTFHLQPKQRDLRPLVLGFFDRYLRQTPATAREGQPGTPGN